MHWMNWVGGGWLMMVLWIALIAGIIYIIIRPPIDRRPTLTSGESALDILKKRYARGEITKEQYDQLKRDIS